MTPQNGSTGTLGRFLGVVMGLVVLAGCGGSTTSSSNSSSPTPVNNTLALEVNLGPANNSVDMAFASVTICVPSSSNCQTIPNIQVDTGSEGLRLLSSVVTLSLPTITDNSNNVLQECVGFADGSYVWGPVAIADIQLAGEKAASVPIQVISASPSFAAPSACASGGGPDDNTVPALGANGILGVGVFREDCGAACTPASSGVPALYYLCPNSVCQVSTVPLASQLQNPVWLFAQDNNGVLISLPSVPAGGEASASGSLTFGIGTQSNNALGNAQTYTTDASGDFQTTYNGIAYSQSYIDSGSNGLYFLDAATLGIPDCPDYPGIFYCPASTVNYTVTNTGLNATTGQVSFSIANADALFSNPNFAAFSNLGGDNPGSFDFGLPFFFGRSVFIGIEGQTGPNSAVGPYWAY